MCLPGRRFAWIVSLLILISFFPSTIFAQTAEQIFKQAAEQIFQQGVERLQQGNLPGAESAFRAVLKMEPENPFALFNLGIVFQAQRRWDEAIAAFSAASRLAPDLIAAPLRLAQSLEGKGALAEALDLYEEVFLEAPEGSPVERFARARIEALAPEVEIRARLDRAIEHMRANRYQPAEEETRAALSINPEHLQVLNTLGLLLGLQNRLTESAEVFQRLIALKPDFLAARVRLAELYEALGDLNKAQDEYDALLFFHEDRTAPEAQEAEERLRSVEDRLVLSEIIERGDSRFEKEEFDVALREYSFALELDPENQAARYKVGITLGRLNRLQEAIAEFSRLVEKNPDHLLAHQRLGQIYHLLHVYSRGEREYQAVLDRNPPEELAAETRAFLERLRSDRASVDAAVAEPFARAKGLLAEGKPDEAILILEALVLARQDEPRFHAHLSLAYEEKGMFDLAIREARGVVEFAPSVESHRRLASLLERGGAVASAVAELEKAEKATVAEETARLQLLMEEKRGAAFRALDLAFEGAEKGDAGAAVAAIREALGIAADQAPVHYRAGVILLSLGGGREAFREFSAAVTLDPEHSAAHLKLARIYEEQGMIRSALEEYRKGGGEEGRAGAIRAEQALFREREAQRRFSRGSRAYRAGDFRRSAEEFEVVSALAPQSVPALYFSGVSLERTGRYDLAETRFRQTLRVNDSYFPAYQHLGIIDETQGRLESAIKNYRKALSLAGDLDSPETRFIKSRLPTLEKRAYFAFSQVLLNYDTNAIQGPEPESDVTWNVNGSLTYYLRKDRAFSIPVMISTGNFFSQRRGTAVSNENVDLSVNSSVTPYIASTHTVGGVSLATGGIGGYRMGGGVSLGRTQEIPTQWVLSYDYIFSGNRAARNFHGNTNSYKLDLLQSFAERGRVSGGATVTNLASGINDQEATNTTLDVGYARDLPTAWRTSLTYSLTFANFKNLDSLALAEFEAEIRRRNTTHTVSGDLSYTIGEGITTRGVATYIFNSSNLPARVVKEEQRRTGQVVSLGDFREAILSVSLVWSF